MNKREKKRKLKKTLKFILIISLILLPFIISLGNPWTRLDDGKAFRLELSMDVTEVEAGSNSVLEAQVRLRNRGPLVYFIKDPDHFNSKEIFIELPDGDILEYGLAVACPTEVVLWGPFRSESWTKPVGGPHFDNGNNRFGGLEGDGFRFNETGEYRIWAELNSEGCDVGNDRLPPPVDQDLRSNVIIVRVV